LWRWGGPFASDGGVCCRELNMNANAIQTGLFVIVVALLVKPVGAYLERVFERRRSLLDPLVLPLERLIHRLMGTDPRSACDSQDMLLNTAATMSMPS
jgi:K+-transporting ATPase A subunit